MYGKRPQAVDARVGPEVDQHHLALQPFEGQRLRVEPAGEACELRRGPEVVQGALRDLALLAADEVVDPRLRSCGLLEPLEGPRVARDARLELQVEPEDHQDPDADDQGSERRANEPRPLAHLREREAAPRRDRDREENEAGTERVREGDQHGLDGEAPGCRDRRHGRDDRPGTRREEQAEADPEQKPAAYVPGAPPAEGEERTLGEASEPGPDE